MSRERIPGSSSPLHAAAAGRATPTPADRIRRLQRAAGNRAVGRLLARRPDQPEPYVGWRRRATTGLLDAHLHLARRSRTR